MQNKGKKLRHIVLYHRPGCHLCEDAEQVLRQAAQHVEFTFEAVDIESKLELLEAHRFDIPVIEIDGKPRFRHRIEVEQILAAVREE